MKSPGKRNCDIYRIAIGGFQHETNTFGLTTAGIGDFEMADSWPGMLIGNDVISGTRGLNLPIAGFIAEARHKAEIELLPVLWCAAEPCSYVEDEAFEYITAKLIDGIREFGPVDGIYLDLHGAMVTKTHDDGEGEILRRLRTEFGEDLPIAVSLDLHANISAEMVRMATSLDAFRTYPHLDMADTGARCVPPLLDQIRGKKSFKAFRQIPYLIPLHSQYTGAGPCRQLYQKLEEVSALSAVSAAIALGFTASDVPDAGPSVIAYADSQVEADEVADALLAEFLALEETFPGELLTPAQAVRKAKQNKSAKPVVIADVQDNPGAGATSDTTGLLSALVDEMATGVVLGLLHDPAMAQKAHTKGIGGIIEGELGGKSKLDGAGPFNGRFKVMALSDGHCVYTGEMYGGGAAELGKCAVLELLDIAGEIKIVISSNRSQCLDQAIFTHIGISLADYRIICVKSTVHYRADFEPIASMVLEAAAPGLFTCELEKIPYKNLRVGIRISPCGRTYSNSKPE